MWHNKKLLIALIVVVVVIAGVAVFIKSKSSDTTTLNRADFPLLAGRIFAENPAEPIINFSKLRVSLNEYYQNNNLSGGLYFEYLPTGTSVRVTGDNLEVAASLIKLPVAMELYRASELAGLDLDQTVVLKEEWLDSNFGKLYQKGAGHKLTLREAAKIMLEDSDNTALKAVAASLQGVVSPEENPFVFLDVDFRQNTDLTISISSRSYSSFLKCLYFSCYLTKEHSQEILDSLTQTDFDSRIVAGVEDGVEVAHKVGNFADITQNDCGIIYLENKNYVLCVMVDGPDNASTDKHIAELSRITYEFVKSADLRAH